MCLIVEEEETHISYGVVRFFIRRKHTQNMDEIDSISSRVAYLIYRLNARYSLQIVQVFASTTTHPDEEV